MDSFFENLHSVAASDQSVIDFVNFCTVIHNQIECKIGEDCYIGRFCSLSGRFFKRR